MAKSVPAFSKGIDQEMPLELKKVNLMAFVVLVIVLFFPYEVYVDS